MTDPDDFRGGYPAPHPTAVPRQCQLCGGTFGDAVALKAHRCIGSLQKNVLTVGMRSDGQVALMSCPDAAKAEGHTFVFPRDTARWIAKEILRITGGSEDVQSEGQEK